MVSSAYLQKLFSNADRSYSPLHPELVLNLCNVSLQLHGVCGMSLKKIDTCNSEWLKFVFVLKWKERHLKRFWEWYELLG